MENAVQIFAIIHLSIMGVSHIVLHREWAAFFILLRSKGAAGVFVNGFLSLGFGSVVVAFHPVWTGIPAILTIYGWLLILKAVSAFIFPSLAIKGLNRVRENNSRRFILPGVAFCILAGLLLYHVLV